MQTETRKKSDSVVPGVSLSRGLEVFTAPNLNDEAEFKLHSNRPLVCMRTMNPKYTNPAAHPVTHVSKRCSRHFSP